jgi:hypothetical protein
MMRYDISLLNKFKAENNISLIGDYNVINSDTLIKYICISDGCLNDHTKRMETLIRSNAYCKDCIIKNMVKKVKNTKKEKYDSKYDVVSLNKFCLLNNIKLNEVYTNINRKTKISYNCINVECLKPHSKSLRALFESGNNAYCKDCMKKHIVKKMEETCLTTYGYKNANQSKAVQEKSQATCLKNWGVKHSQQSKLVQEKSQATCLENHGVPFSFQSPEIREKSKITINKLFGCDYVSQNINIKLKSQATCLKNHGVPFSFQSPEIREKSKITNREKYGCDYPRQNPEHFEQVCKNTFKLKDYTLPSGKIIHYQGYEHFALNYLLRIEKINEIDVINGTSNIPTIWYTADDGKKHHHYVDIFIPSQNRMIEVKSTWTFSCKKDNVLLKQETAKKLGFIYEIWIYNKNGKLVNLIK